MLFFYGIKLVKPRYYYYVLMILIVIGDGYFSMLPGPTIPGLPLWRSRSPKSYLARALRELAPSTNFPFKAVTSPPVRYFPFQSLRLIPLSCRPFENKKNASAPETRRRPPLQAPPPPDPSTRATPSAFVALPPVTAGVLCRHSTQSSASSPVTSHQHQLICKRGSLVF
jgi:hypothetical protein